MINVNQITSQLARMPDQALQQYAAMHKNDPYTVSLALAESNRRKELRTGAQAQGAGQQTKVVDQSIEAMMPQAPQMPQGQAQAMPEDIGIGALPAPNMQGMADGGIVAFGGGGDVPGFADGVYVGEGGQYYAEPLTAAELAQRDPLARLKQFSAWAGRNVERDPVTGETVRRDAAAAPALAGPAVSALYPDESRRGAMATPSIPGITLPAAAGPRAATGPRAQAAQTAPADVGFMQRFKGAVGERPDFEKQGLENTASEKARAEEGIAKLKADLAAEAEGRFKGQEERIGKRETALEKSKDTNTGLAFLEAGLAMMQSRGPGLSGIAQGAGVGVKQYAAGIDKIKSAQEKLDEARDRMEELRQNQSSMNSREIRAEERGIREIVNRGNRDALTGAKEAYGEERATALAATASDIATRQSELDRQSRLQIAGMPGDQQKMLTVLGGGDLAKGLRLLTEIQAGKSTPLQSYEKYIQAFAGKDTTVSPPMTPQQYSTMLNQFMAAQNPGKVPGVVETGAAMRP